MAEAIRRHDKERREDGSDEAEADELYAGVPISDWAELSPDLHGLFIDYRLPDDTDQVIHELPPSTRIERFTSDGSDPRQGDELLADHSRYHETIKNWMSRNGGLDADKANLWTLLLAHHFDFDGTDLSQFAGCSSSRRDAMGMWSSLS